MLKLDQKFIINHTQFQAIIWKRQQCDNGARSQAIYFGFKRFKWKNPDEKDQKCQQVK